MNYKKDKETRKQQRLAKLGSSQPVCVVCGENSWECLELHHIRGQHYGDDLAIVCRNCHRKLSDNQHEHSNQLTVPPSNIERIAHLLLGLADLLTLLAPSLRKSAQQLLEIEKRI